MKSLLFPLFLTALFLFACSSSSDTTGKETAPAPASKPKPEYSIRFDPETYEEVIELADPAGESTSAPPPPPPPPVREEIMSSSPAEDPASAKSRKRDMARESAPADDFAADGERIEAEEDEIASDPGVDYPARQLTAGEWSDLENWDFWLSEEENPHRAAQQGHWRMFPEQRYTLRLTNSEYRPLIDQPVHLLAPNGDTLWTARTDHEGKAELWAGFFGEEDEVAAILLHRQGEDHRLDHPKTREEGVNHLILPHSCHSPQAVDIMFVVDATGSMGDEINYLKAELQDVIGRVKKEHRELQLRLGTVFYRDTPDEYVTRSSPLLEDESTAIGFIRKQSANGGGDFPEAVEKALRVAITEQSWLPEARARLLFLLLDAPPHHNPQILDELQKYTHQAAAQGIHIIPVTGSGIDKPTEYLMKFLGMATGGTYTFLTDHSGIGNAHIEATARNYEVEYLNDLLVRLIGEYSRDMCQAEDRWRGDNDSPAQARLRRQINIYPNPATDFLHLELQTGVETLQLLSTSGQVLKDYGPWQSGNSRLDLDQIPPGSYFIHLKKNGAQLNIPFVVVRA